MRGFIDTQLGIRLSRQARNQQGFALVKTLMVIGIFVALAAVIVTLAIQLTGGRVQAAENAKWDAVQTSIDTMMAEKEMTNVVASTASTRISDTQDWAQGARTQTMADYTRYACTDSCCQWSATGRLTAQFNLNADNSCSITQTNP